MGDWLLNLPLPWMALFVFVAIFLATAAIYFVVTRLAVDARGRAFKALSPGMLPPLGIIFGLLVGFVAVQVWSDFDRAKIAVATEAFALRSIVLLADSLPLEQQAKLHQIVNAHVEEAVKNEWGTMAKRRMTLETRATHLMDALRFTLAMTPADETQKTVQRELIGALNRAFEARRQRIVVSQTSVSAVKWAAILVQALCALIAIAMVHSDNKLTCAIALTLFATGVAVSVLLIAAYSRPFTGQISVGPQLLQQVVAPEPPPAAAPPPPP